MYLIMSTVSCRKILSSFKIQIAGLGEDVVSY